MITNTLFPEIAAALYLKSITDGLNGLGLRLANAIARGVPADTSREVPALTPTDIATAVAALSTADQASLHTLLTVLGPPQTPAS